MKYDQMIDNSAEYQNIHNMTMKMIDTLFLPARAARCVTDAARLAVLRRRKSESEDCCTKCLPGPEKYGI